ncbi:tetratricopeptide repeat protein [Roseateles terrae]|uniref:Aspartyl protease/Tfp pilus assembly protein PilF n=1 Tax=Roseateles terrae TaxID=431060 RepID=A0ABR6GLW3_9BURK|nr:tetratricopeptide repeat protein [Roseateles terrae]MBB3193088.1 putative aspartyl protease/Tfp pilus assembly protein PilF [Roseateles terrae]
MWRLESHRRHAAVELPKLMKMNLHVPCPDRRDRSRSVHGCELSQPAVSSPFHDATGGGAAGTATDTPSCGGLAASMRLARYWAGSLGQHHRMFREDKVLQQQVSAADADSRASAGRFWSRLLHWRAPCLAALLVACAPATWAQCVMENMEIPVRIVGNRPIAMLTLNGVEAPMLVDSGAFHSILSPSTAARLNLPLRHLPFGMDIEGYTGDIEAQLTRVERVGLRGAEMKKVDFVVGGSELGNGIMGILGRNILSAMDTEYDFAHGAIRLSNPGKDCRSANLAYWANGAPVVTAELKRGRNSRDTTIRLDIAINGKTTEALLDTGAPVTVLTLKTAKRAGIAVDSLVANGYSRGAGEGRAKSYLGMVDTFELGGEKISNVKMSIDDNDVFDSGMLLGLDYFLAHRIYISKLQGKFYATWNGSPIFAAHKGMAMREEDLQYAARPDDVQADNPDALARRGNAFAANREHDKALADLNRAIELAPTVAGYRLDRAHVLLAQSHPKEALMDLDEALRLDPAQADARVMRAQLRVRQRRGADARADLEALDAQLTPSAPQRIQMATMFFVMGRLPEAIRQWSLWLPTHENDHDYPTAMNNRCWSRARLGVDLTMAVKDCEAAIGKDEANAAYRDSLGWVYLRLGQPAQARKAFDAALERDAKLSFALYGRGLALLQLKDAAGSQADLAAARQAKSDIDTRVRRMGFEVAPDAPVGAAPDAAKAPKGPDGREMPKAGAAVGEPLEAEDPASEASRGTQAPYQ